MCSVDVISERASSFSLVKYEDWRGIAYRALLGAHHSGFSIIQQAKTPFKYIPHMHTPSEGKIRSLLETEEHDLNCNHLL